ncbi:MAG: hypothetical protein EZS28_043317, partial [Streblomastix strix]
SFIKGSINDSTDVRERQPKWFIDDEKRNFFPIKPESKETAARYKEQLREMNERPIKKIAEAKARRRHKALRQLKTADAVATKAIDNIGLTEAERGRELKRAAKLASKVKRPGKQVIVGAGAKPGKKERKNKKQGYIKKGKAHVVDRRMKKDKQRFPRTTKGTKMKKAKAKAKIMRIQKKKQR